MFRHPTRRPQPQPDPDLVTRIQASGLLDNIPKWQPPPPNPNWPLPTGDQLADYVADSLIGAQEQCQRKNDDSISQYYHLADNFYRSNTSGKTPILPFPVVPRAAGIGLDGDRFVMVEGVGLPVCNRIPVPGDHTKTMAQVFESVPIGTIDISVAFQKGSQFGFFHVGPNDRVLDGTTVAGTSADGVSGSFNKIGTPVGQWPDPYTEYNGYYERVRG